MVRLDIAFRRGLWAIALFACGLWLAGCDTTTTTTPPNDQVKPSEGARIKFKGALRLANNLSQALSIPKDELCKELGLYPCFTQVHRINLGGMEPYKEVIRVPWEVPPLSAPIAAERVALASCQERVKRDFADASKAVIFKPLVGASDASEAARKEVVTSLYKRLFQRLPNEAELGHLVGFWDKVKASSKKPLQDWSVLTCFGLVTSTEFLFY